MNLVYIQRKITHFLFTHALSATILALLLSLMVTLWFLYLFFYQPLRVLPVLYSLQSETTNVQLNSKTLEQARTAITNKQQRPMPSLQNVSSPF